MLRHISHYQPVIRVPLHQTDQEHRAGRQQVRGTWICYKHSHLTLRDQPVSLGMVLNTFHYYPLHYSKLKIQHWEPAGRFQRWILSLVQDKYKSYCNKTNAYNPYGSLLPWDGTWTMSEWHTRLLGMEFVANIKHNTPQARLIAAYEFRKFLRDKITNHFYMQRKMHTLFSQVFLLTFHPWRGLLHWLKLVLILKQIRKTQICAPDVKHFYASNNSFVE